MLRMEVKTKQSPDVKCGEARFSSLARRVNVSKSQTSEITLQLSVSKVPAAWWKLWSLRTETAPQSNWLLRNGIYNCRTSPRKLGADPLAQGFIKAVRGELVELRTA